MNNGKGHQMAPLNGRSVLEAVCPQCPLVTDITGLYHRLEILDRAKSDFIQIASHELRTPLALIKGYTEVMDSSCRQLEDDVTTLSLRGILSGVSRLEELVNTMLCASQVSHGQLIIQPRPYSVKVLLKEAVEVWRETLTARRLWLDLVCEGAKAGDVVMWNLDRPYFSLALYHLLQNAVKFTPDGGAITLRLTRLLGRRIQLELADTGIGVPVEQQELIFEKFYRIGEARLHSTSQTRFNGAGPGLGLYLVRGIVEAHDGRIWVESNDDGGTTFKIQLPWLAEWTDGDG